MFFLKHLDSEEKWKNEFRRDAGKIIPYLACGVPHVARNTRYIP